MINNEEFRSYLFSRLSMNSEVIGGMNNITTGEFTTPLQESYTITYQCRMYVQKQSSVPSGAAICLDMDYLLIS